MNIIKRINAQAELMKELVAAHSAGETVGIDDERMFEIVHGFQVMRTKVLLWHETGMNTFVLTKDLLEAFMHTDIPMDARPSDFHYPFDVFMIEGQAPLFQTELPGHARDVHSILGITRQAAESQEGVSYVEKNGTPATGVNWDLAITGFFQGFGQLSSVENIMLHTKKDQTLGECASTPQRSKVLLPLDEKDARNLINVFFNTVMYVNDVSRNREETETKGYRSFKEKKGGKFVSHPYILLRPPRSYKSLTQSDSQGRRIEKRFVVRGHWRNQAHGEGLKERKMIWIKPFLKGSQFTASEQKKYLVK